MERKMTRKSKAKQERYTDKQRMNFIERMHHFDTEHQVGGFFRKGQWVNNVFSTQDYLTISVHTDMRDAIDAAMSLESKLVRVRSKPKSGGKSK